MVLNPGAKIGNYEIRSRLGKGGMGEVYCAMDIRLDRLVALKLLSAELIAHKDRLNRFRQEARATSSLSHPNIITIYDIGQADSAYYIASEFVDGVTLRKYMKQFRRGAQEALDLAIQVVSALEAAHTKGIVHRDVKPENIMVRADGYVKVLDFGLAKLLDVGEAGRADLNASTATDILTDPGAMMGTVAYMSPEQVRGRAVDGRADIWSLGVVLYEMLAGRLPFRGDTKGDLIVSILDREPEQLLTPDGQTLPDSLHALLAKALCKEAAGRHQTAGELLTELRQIRRGLEVAADAGGVGLTTGGVGSNASQPGAKNGGMSTAPAGAGTDTGGAARATVDNRGHAFGELKTHLPRALVLFATLAAAAAVVYLSWHRLAPARRAEDPSRRMTFTKLLDAERVLDAVLSPDGKYVAMVVRAGHGQAITVTQVATATDAPVADSSGGPYKGLTFSRDGSYIYYLRQESEGWGLFRVPLMGGAPVKILPDVPTTVTFSPDSRRMAFVRKKSDGTALVIAEVDGSGERELASSAGGKSFSVYNDMNHGPAWSPDGSSIACPTLGNVEPYPMGVAVVSTDDGAVRPLGPQTWVVIGQLAWLSDGAGIVFNANEDTPSSTTQLWLLSYPDGVVSRLTNDSNIYNSVSLADAAGAMLVTQVSRVSSIWAMGVAGDGATQLRHGRSIGTGGVTWPAGGRVVYVGGEGGDMNLWSVKEDGSDPKQMTYGDDTNAEASVSPDNRYIFYVSYRGGGSHVWRMNADGSDRRQLTFGQYEDWPQVSPDGRWVVYHSEESLRDRVLKMPAEGGAAVALTDEPAKHPAISPDGKLLAFFSREEEGAAPWRIKIVPFGGGGAPVRSFDVPQEVARQWHGMRWTPDGKALTYISMSGGVSNIWTRPLAGGPPRMLTNFEDDQISAFAWSPDGKRLMCVRVNSITTVLLIKNYR